MLKINRIPPPITACAGSELTVNGSPAKGVTEESCKKKQFYGIDVLKLVLALLIVVLHFPGSQMLDTYIKPALTRFAVPCFFIISGYFLYGADTKRKAYKALRNLIPIVLAASIVYWIIWGRQSLSMKEICYFFLFNSAEKFGHHLWYIYAYIYVLVIVSFFSERVWKQAFWIIPLLIVCDLVLGKYSRVLLGMEFYCIVCRNWLFTGLTYVLIGGLLRYSNLTISNNKLILSIILLLATTTAEKMLLVEYGMDVFRDSYISTPFLAVAVFLLFLNMKFKKSGLSLAGKKYSKWIYLVHPAIYKFIFYLIMKT